MTPQITFNETAYAENGPIYVGAQFLWNTFFDYASYTSGIAWMALFGFDKIKDGIQKFLRRRRSKGSENIADQYNDQLNVLQRAYKDVPLWWYITLFTVHFIVLVTIVAKGVLFIPIWTYFVAIATGALLVVPLGWLYALSNFQLVS